MNNLTATQATEAAQALAFVSDEFLGGRTSNRDELGVYLATHTDFPLDLFTATIEDAQDAARAATAGRRGGMG